MKNNRPEFINTGTIRIKILKMNDKKSQHVEVLYGPKFPSLGGVRGGFFKENCL